MEDSKITHTPNIKINKLSRKNSYSWEIRIADEDIKSIPKRLKEIDDEMLKLFSKEEGGKE